MGKTFTNLTMNTLCDLMCGCPEEDAEELAQQNALTYNADCDSMDGMKAQYTLLETAKIFNVKVRTVREWLKLGKLQAEKHGNMWAVSAAEIDRLKSRLLPCEETYYSVGEVAKKFGVSVSTVRRWLHNGLVSHKPTGKKEVFVSEAELKNIEKYRHK